MGLVCSPRHTKAQRSDIRQLGVHVVSLSPWRDPMYEAGLGRLGLSSFGWHGVLFCYCLFQDPLRRCHRRIDIDVFLTWSVFPK